MTEKIILPSRLHDADEDTDALHWETARGYEILDIPPPPPKTGKIVNKGFIRGSMKIPVLFVWLLMLVFTLMVYIRLIGLYNV